MSSGEEFVATDERARAQEFRVGRIAPEQQGADGWKACGRHTIDNASSASFADAAAHLEPRPPRIVEGLQCLLCVGLFLGILRDDALKLFPRLLKLEFVRRGKRLGGHTCGS